MKKESRRIEAGKGTGTEPGRVSVSRHSYLGLLIVALLLVIGTWGKVDELVHPTKGQEIDKAYREMIRSLREDFLMEDDSLFVPAGDSLFFSTGRDSIKVKGK